MNEIMYAPDGYNKDGSSRPWREVEIIDRNACVGNPNYVKIKYIDDGTDDYCYINSLKKSKK